MKRILFMHVPKTAGTSILVYLRKVYAERLRLELRTQDNTLQTIRQEDVAAADCIWLHAPFREFHQDAGDCFKFTFFRHPMERIQSLYAYLRNPAVIANQNFTYTPNRVVQSLKAVERMSFEDFVLSDDPVHSAKITNVYAKWLSERDEATFSTRKEYLRHCIERMATCFDLIGLTSHIAEDMELIRQMCFSRHPLLFGETRVNESQKTPAHLSVTDKASERLRAELDLDFLIFEEAYRMRSSRQLAISARY